MRFILILFLFVSFARLAAAAVNGFTESFDGTGDYESTGGIIAGLDNPGWFIGGDGELVDGGYEFFNTNSYDKLTRTIDGIGSFTTRIEIKNLDLGEIGANSPPDSGASVSLLHLLNDEPSGSGRAVLLLSLSETSLNDSTMWYFRLGVDGESTGSFVPRGSEIAIELAFDHAESMVSIAYDNDTSDTELAFESQIPVSARTFFQSHQMELSFSAYEHGRANGLLDQMSVESTEGLAGDFNGNGVLDADDINTLTDEVRLGGRDPSYDLNGDDVVDSSDRTYWVHELKKTYYGDINFDGLFDTQDLIISLAEGRYEDERVSNAFWQTGDWDGDGDYTSSDLVLALADGGFEAGPRPAVVPEPNTLAPLIVGLFVFGTVPRTRRTPHRLM